MRSIDTIRDSDITVNELDIARLTYKICERNLDKIEEMETLRDLIDY